MRVIVSGGGTGGHIYPAIALINQLKERNLLDDVLYVGTKSGLESRIVKDLNIPFTTVEIQGFKRKLSLDNIKTVNLFFSSISKSKKIIKEFKPDIVIGTGGYVSSAVVYAAHKMKVPTIIHEQNSIAGVTNKFLGHFVDKIAISFAEVATEFPEKSKLILTGNPRAQEVIKIKPNERLSEFNLVPHKPTVLIFGGSRGARPLNSAVVDSISSFNEANYQVLFVTGKIHYDNVIKQISAKKNPNVSVVPYVDEMPEILPDVSLIVGRSGATSIAEITALGIPAIFIPSPYVTHDHQTKNAEILEKVGAASVIKESDLTKESLLESINNIMGNAEVYKNMEEESKELGIPNAADLLIDEMLKLVK
ncbi:UDP-N-acetylglucosamine--N-acetylmuramyl-(pentapeptide) pyrophosphoryl-undecaprenol N-acetylglucosamine transferase [Companilactobacillus sp. RD055328]|uniref:undecaprenyldiphospho-muramoylpentapeptide beta-N-acetylglucosaminyltransferase n=1 Tax=Companilactobacillus sp. RD055328 TaxID=2916634 RepID=UPI001FC80498|nr:undecaprenyldiphospho-muramoylpentapeptide beta-N-acetylglucosaminyltransferase [Companilactobacillus sp. RD055328]GKQ42849.1 UDP-N-acetylglucosamine--N-acetylmuramyl-(pentapeptide) pyrophosphoryl-undecaprenol N-acetylglucosamine transferase [Companilactobacillus sp. RD055328]